MPNKGQIISFFIIFAVIIGAMWQIISHGDNLKRSRESTESVFVVEQPKQQLLYEAPQKPKQEAPIVDDIELTEECQTEECLVEMPNVIPVEIESVFVLINDGSGDPKEFMLEVSTSTTAFDLLQEASLTAGFAIESREYDFGVLIEAINNKRNGQGDKYWFFYVNSELLQLTPDKVTVNPGDKIEFIFTNR